MSGIEDGFQELHDEIATLKAENEELHSTVYSLTDRNSELENKVESLKNKSYRLEEEKKSLEYDIDDKNRKIRDLEGKISSLERGW